ncbi:hypothetical protein CC80DRAFT_596931 [Byssothecium circinans]|uniref:Protein kinase domain-containing protein n=1 Tax=Byssothecium circinans TaxID=147558 RepID=A0A6A5TGP2_9PLEO|nr:hypothetical protein CC80DRAFT_596931 [Byssothecium circinans]
MGIKQSRTTPSHQADDTTSSTEDQLSDVSEDSYYSKSLIGLCDTIIHDIKSAVGESYRWAGDENDVAGQLGDASKSLKHWRSSIQWIATGGSPPADEELLSTIVSGFLDILEKHEKFLAGTIRSYLDEVSQTVGTLRAIHADGPIPLDPSTVNGLTSSLHVSVTCLGSRLIPLRAFANTKRYIRLWQNEIPELEVPESKRSKATKSDARGKRRFTGSEYSADGLQDRNVNEGSDWEPESGEGSICHLLHQSFALSAYSHTKFLPLRTLKRIITTERILAELEPKLEVGDKTSTKAYLAHLADQIQSTHMKVFAILSLLERGAEIVNFVDEGVSDEDLPLESDYLHDGQITRHDSFGSPLGLFQKWGQADRSLFLKYQFHLHVPDLTLDFTPGVVTHTDFRFETFPILETGRILPSQDETVVWARIHPDSIVFHAMSKKVTKPDIFAIKKIVGARNIFADDKPPLEVSNLKCVSGNHHHLVRLLGTFSYKYNLELIFPLAYGPLCSLWEDKSQNPVWDSWKAAVDDDTAYWISSQVLGLMDGLDYIHRPRAKGQSVNGRHGNINPTNILRFPDSQHDKGRLVMSGFSNAAFCKEVSMLNEQPANKITGLGHNYRPPESDSIDGAESQASDIWSFGCVLLDFVCWALGGYELIEEFYTRRRTLYIDGSYGTQLFEVIRSEFIRSEVIGAPTGRFFAGLKPEVSEASVIPLLSREYIADLVQFIRTKLHGHQHSTAYICDLLDIIENDMLVQQYRRSSSTAIRDKFKAIDLKVILHTEYGQQFCGEDRPFKEMDPFEIELSDELAGIFKPWSRYYRQPN